MKGPGPIILFPPPEGQRGGYWAYLSVVLEVSVDVGAAAVGLPVDVYMDTIEKWSGSIGFLYGVRIDRETKTITQGRSSR